MDATPGLDAVLGGIAAVILIAGLLMLLNGVKDMGDRF
ncbi:MAG: NAD synthetase [Leptolyngbyaceae cyanobacterium T60_A2020_046]|nr:NAD synthetase [Leptolyngbyaceae cyanobacterium T60_A2020_046]